jgi:hypothetical protein
MPKKESKSARLVVVSELPTSRLAPPSVACRRVMVIFMAFSFRGP